MDAIVWIVFLVAAPALLYWMWNSNRQRRARWRAWCRARGWRIEIDNEGSAGAEHAPGLPDFPIDQSHRRRQSVDMCGHGRFGSSEAATWEWNTAWRDMPVRGRGAMIAGKLHAVALRLPAPAAAPFCLLAPQMALMSLSGMLSLPQVDPGIFGTFGRWALHAHDAGHSRDWMRARAGADPMAAAPAELAVFQVEGEWMVAWHLGETRLDRIEPTLAWLSAIAVE